jgi:hypothetical protein
MITRILILIFTINTLVDARNDSNWNYSLDLNFLVSLNIFSSDWNTSSNGMILWIGDISTSAEKESFGWLNHEYAIDAQFGQTRLQNRETKRWTSPEISANEFHFFSQFTFLFGPVFKPCISIQLNSQIIDQEDYENIHYINPVELSESIGFSSSAGEKNKLFFNFKLSAALRQTINRNSTADDNNFTYHHGKIFNEGGAQAVFDLRLRVKKLLFFNSKIALFQTLVNSDLSDNKQHFNIPDIDWNTQISIKCMQFLELSYFSSVKFNQDLTSKYKFKQTIGVGLAYSFRTS